MIKTCERCGLGLDRELLKIFTPLIGDSQRVCPFCYTDLRVVERI